MGRKAKPKKEFIPPTSEALIGNFEAWEEISDQIDSLNEQKKMGTKKLSEAIKSYADDCGCSASDMKSAYKYFLKAKKQGEVTDDTQFTLMSLVDMQISKEAEEKKEKKDK